MVQQDKLFVLIKSLTSGEKTYFSKYSRIHHAKEKPDYLRLFEFIDTQEEYDENGVKKHFKKDKFIKQLSRKKTQLKEKILESLSIFHADRTVETSLRQQMVLLPVLYEKAAQHKDLIKDYEKLIKDIKKTAEQHECFSVLIELFEWERLLIKFQDERSKLEPKTSALIEKREKYRESLSQEIKLANLYEQVYLIIIKDTNILNPKNRDEMRVLLKDLPDDISDISLSKKFQRYYYFLKSNYHRMNGEIQLSFDFTQKMIATYDSEAIGSYETAIDYKNVLCYYLVVCKELKKTEYFSKIIKKMRASYGNSAENMRSFNTTRFQSLCCWLDVGQFSSAMEIADEIDEHWVPLCQIIPKRRQLAFCYNIAVAYWLGGNLERAVFWISLILNFENVKEGERFIYDARVIQLPIYYEYQDENLFNRIESTRRVLADRKRLLEFEKIVITYFRKLVRCLNSKESMKVLSDFYNELLLYKKRNPHKYIPTYEAIKFWCEQKGIAAKLEAV